MSFTKKKLELTITLGTGPYGEKVGDTVTLSGYRMRASCQTTFSIGMDDLHLQIYGLSQEMMTRLTVTGYVQSELRGANKVLLAAGDDENGMSLIYEGSISEAWADYSGSPDVVFSITAYCGLYVALKPVGATSFRGSTKVSDIMRTLADLAGLVFEDRGVDVVLSNPYFPGSALDQIRACAEAADILYRITLGKLIICPRKERKDPNAPVLISKETGLVGYPQVSGSGMLLTTEFNPNLTIPGVVEVQSSLGPYACGLFDLWNVGYELSSEMPGGPWFSHVRCYRFPQ
ncbi:MAG: hypothetical protein KGL40_07040 [Rhodocyclaceae bacterium]|nr:hypothetical protein [Rhodocyclaceae bacterium]